MRPGGQDGTADREDIDDAAADGEVARLLHGVGPSIARRREPRCECGGIVLLGSREAFRERVDARGRGHGLHQRMDGCDDDRDIVRGKALHAPDRGETLREQLRGDTRLARGRLERRNADDGAVEFEQLGLDLLGVVKVRNTQHDRTAGDQSDGRGGEAR